MIVIADLEGFVFMQCVGFVGERSNRGIESFMCNQIKTSIHFSF